MASVKIQPKTPDGTAITDASITAELVTAADSRPSWTPADMQSFVGVVTAVQNPQGTYTLMLQANARELENTDYIVVMRFGGRVYTNRIHVPHEGTFDLHDVLRDAPSGTGGSGAVVHFDLSDGSIEPRHLDADTNDKKEAFRARIGAGTGGGGGGSDITELRAGRGLGGGGSSGIVTMGIPDDALENSMIPDGEITRAKLHSDIVTGGVKTIGAGDGTTVDKTDPDNPIVATDKDKVPFLPTKNVGGFVRVTAGGWDTAVINTDAHAITGVAAENGLSSELRNGVVHIGIEDGGVTEARMADGSVAPDKLKAGTAAEQKALRDKIHASGNVASIQVTPSGVADLSGLGTAFGIVLSNINETALASARRVFVTLNGVNITSGLAKSLWSVSNHHDRILNLFINPSLLQTLRISIGASDTSALLVVSFYDAESSGNVIGRASTNIGIGQDVLLAHSGQQQADWGEDNPSVPTFIRGKPTVITVEERTKLAGIADHAEANAQADFAVTDPNNDRFIRNKPPPVLAAIEMMPKGIRVNPGTEVKCAMIFTYLNTAALAGVKLVRVDIEGAIVLSDNFVVSKNITAHPPGGILYFAISAINLRNIFNSVDDPTTGTGTAFVQVQFFTESYNLEHYVGRAFAYLGIGDRFFQWPA